MIKKDHFWGYIFIVLIGLIACWLMYSNTPYGSGVSPDSTSYAEASQNLLSRKGFTVDSQPVTHYPPLYPLLLAAITIFENNFAQASRSLNAILFGFNVSMVGLAVYMTTKRNLIATTFALLAIISSPRLFELHSMAWTEPLFISFLLVLVISLSKLFRKPIFRWFILSAISLSLAVLTRYIGIAFLPVALILVYLGFRNHKFKVPLRNTVIWLIASCAPLIVFFATNILITGSPTNRNFVYHPLTTTHFRNLINTASDLLLPVSTSALVKVIILVFLIISFIIGLVISIKKDSESNNGHSLNIVMPMLCFLFSISYIAFLFITISFFDAATPFDWRILSPIYVIMVIGAVSVVWTVSRVIKTAFIWWFFLLLVGISIIYKTPLTIELAADIRKNGRGYTSRMWQDSESIAFIKGLSRDEKVYTNGWDIVKFATGRDPSKIPAHTNSMSMESNASFDEQLRTMCKEINENNASLVYFYEISWRWYLPTLENIETTCQPTEVRLLTDGKVFFAK